MRASFVFDLETKVLESGGRVEKLIAQVAWSPVLSFHSLWWFVVQCHLLVLVHCVFLKTNVTAPFYQEMLEHFMLPSADPHCQKHQKLVKWPWCWCVDWPANSPDLNPRENRWGIVKRKMRNKRQMRWKMQMSWRPLSKKPGLPYHLSSATKLITSIPRQIEAVIKAKWTPTKYWVAYIYSKWTYFPEGQQFNKK